MRQLNNSIKLFILFVFFSCQGHYTNNAKIIHAEMLMRSNADSAYAILASISSPRKMTDADYAAWCLHFTHAKYKTYRDVKSDSIIEFALKYYSSTPLDKYTGEAYYLSGCIAEMRGDDQKAIFSYKMAENYLKKSNENQMKGLVQFNLAFVFFQNELYTQSMHYLRKSLVCFKAVNDVRNEAYSYRQLSDVCLALDMPRDSVLYYSNLAIKQARAANDLTNYYSCLTRQGEILMDFEDSFAQSKECILKGYRFSPERKSYYATYLAYAYSKLNKPDSAKYFLKIAMSDTTCQEDNTLKFLAAAYVSKENKHQTDAFQYLEQAYKYRAKSFRKKVRSQLYRIDKQYDLNQKERENASLKIDNQQKQIFIDVLLMVGMVVWIISLIINGLYRKKQAKITLEQELKSQQLELEMKIKQEKNEQKQKLLLLKLQNRIDNTLYYNRLRKGCVEAHKRNEFIDTILMQSVFTEKEWQFYIDEINNILDNKIERFSTAYGGVSKLDLIVITLICLKIDITDSCNLLNMNKSTMYKRRNRIKDRICLDTETDLEEWVKTYFQT